VGENIVEIREAHRKEHGEEDRGTLRRILLLVSDR